MKPALFLSGAQKAAIIMVNLPQEITAQIMKSLPPDDIKDITVEMAKIEDMDEEIQRAVFEEFLKMTKNKFITAGGVDFLRNTLEKVLGPEEAKEILKNVESVVNKSGFRRLKSIDPYYLASILSNEHPQTVALILSYMDEDFAGKVIDGMSEELQAEIIKRIAQIDQISPHVMKDIEKSLENKLMTVQGGRKSVGGIHKVAKLLNKASRATERSVLSILEQENKELVEKIRELMFVFEDIVKLDDRAMQKIVKSIDSKDLALALKAASEEVKAKFFNNMSQRAVEMIKDEIEYMGPVKITVVEEAQKRIVEVVRKLEQSGEIAIARGGEEAFV